MERKWRINPGLMRDVNSRCHRVISNTEMPIRRFISFLRTAYQEPKLVEGTQCKRIMFGLYFITFIVDFNGVHETHPSVKGYQLMRQKMRTFYDRYSFVEDEYSVAEYQSELCDVLLHIANFVEDNTTPSVCGNGYLWYIAETNYVELEHHVHFVLRSAVAEVCSRIIARGK